MVKGCSENKDPLRVVPHPQAFHFYTAIGDYCGVSAHSLEEFADALQYVCSQAILFHFERGDFQKWVRNIICDNELAKSIENLRLCERHLMTEGCREDLVDLVRVRMLQLEAQKMPPCLDKHNAQISK